MAKVKEVSVNVGMTINIGNFESVKVSAGAVLELGPKDTPKKVYSDAWKICQKEIEDQVKDIKKAHPTNEAERS